MVKRSTWLSVTPEPERELPSAVATLRQGGRPSAAEIAREAERIERLVVGGRERAWLDYLHEVVGLIDRRAPAGDSLRADRDGVPNGDAALATARARAIAVIANHHNLLVALPGRGAERTADERAHLDALAIEAHNDRSRR